MRRLFSLVGCLLSLLSSGCGGSSDSGSNNSGGAASGGSSAGGSSAGGSAGKSAGGSAGKGAGGSSAGTAGTSAAAGTGGTSSGGVCDGFPPNCIPLCEGGLCDCYCEPGTGGTGGDCEKPPPDDSNCTSCYSDAHCPDTQLCYGGSCAGPVVGACHAAPSGDGECWYARDCADGQQCVGAMICGCDMACFAPDTPGTCQ